MKINHISPIGRIEPEYTYLNQICDFPDLRYNIPNLIVIGENWDADIWWMFLKCKKSVNDWKREIRLYATIEELDESVLNRLISRILVGEVKKIDGQKYQEVKIIYNFVSEIPDMIK